MVKLAVNSIVFDDNRPVDGVEIKVTLDVLKNIIIQQSGTINQQNETIAEQAQDITRLDHLVKLLQKAVFGQKSERIIDAEEEVQGVFADLLKEYHQRSHSESFHSAFKRVYGEVRKVNYTARFVQITARIILHNFRRLSYFVRAN